MTTDTHVNTISGTLASDPARWADRISGESPGARMAAEREIVATASAVLGKHARIVPHHNSSGQWAVDIERAAGSRVYHLHWSSSTTNSNGSHLIPISRGEALTVLLHELFHVLYTDWVERPHWCHPSHWQQFFGVLNMSEDVRIEDAGENEVPVFASLRKIENERLMQGNESGYAGMDSIRHVCLALYAARCVGTLAPKFVSFLDEAERRAFDVALPDFMWACDQRSTQDLLDKLEPVYVALLPFLPPVGDSGKGGEGGTDERSDGGDEQSEGGSDEQPQGGSDDQSDDTSQSGGGEQSDEGDDEQSQGGDGGDDEPQEDSNERSQGGSGRTDEQSDDGDEQSHGGGGGDDAPSRDGGITGGDGEQDDEQSLRPDRPRGDWDEERKDVSRAGKDQIDLLIDGSFINYADEYGHDASLKAATSVASRVVRSQLNRVLQHNADGSYAGRKRRGSFDVSSARRLSLGDTRVFRTKQGPRGSRDFSLVMLLDASSSVRGTCGAAIAQAGYAIKRASEQVHGLDVAVGAYGGRGMLGGIPFGSTDAQWRILPAICAGVTNGRGGGTDETSAIIWARRASDIRNAEQPLIVVLTDGSPNNSVTVREEIDEARRTGIITGGIGISRRVGLSPVVPNYHEFYATARDLSVIPSVLAELLRTMMKAR